jgi:anti-sigma factor RsiW
MNQDQTDRIITRIIDGEATAGERSTFAADADGNPSMWKSLALAQEQAAVLARTLDDATSTACAVALPAPRRVQFGAWPMAVSGWAAAVLIAAIWILLPGVQRGTHDGQLAVLHDEPAATLAADPLLRAYLNAQYVLGEQEPLMLEIEELRDGRIALRMLRRIEEVAFLQPGDELPVDEDGRLLLDPHALRARSAERSLF